MVSGEKGNMVIFKIIVGFILIILSNIIPVALQPEFFGGGIILIISIVLIDLPTFIIKNPSKFVFNFKLLFLILKRQKIRFSMSYQYRIKIGNKYLLVKNRNFEWYQFVGGKYKKFKQADTSLLKMNASDDYLLGNSRLRQDDLALFIPAKNALKFINWFNSRKEREIDHWREFYEELIISKNGKNILPMSKFPYIHFRYIDTVSTPLRRAPSETGWNCWEYLQYDILEPEFTPEQLAAITDLKKAGETDYIKWASDALIENCGYNHIEQKKEYQISIHTKWVKNLKWSKE